MSAVDESENAFVPDEVKSQSVAVDEDTPASKRIKLEDLGPGGETYDEDGYPIKGGIDVKDESTDDEFSSGIGSNLQPVSVSVTTAAPQKVSDASFIVTNKEEETEKNTIDSNNAKLSDKPLYTKEGGLTRKSDVVGEESKSVVALAHAHHTSSVEDNQTKNQQKKEESFSINLTIPPGPLGVGGDMPTGSFKKVKQLTRMAKVRNKAPSLGNNWGSHPCWFYGAIVDLSSANYIALPASNFKVNVPCHAPHGIHASAKSIITKRIINDKRCAKPSVTTNYDINDRPRTIGDIKKVEDYYSLFIESRGNEAKSKEDKGGEKKDVNARDEAKKKENAKAGYEARKNEMKKRLTYEVLSISDLTEMCDDFWIGRESRQLLTDPRGVKSLPMPPQSFQQYKHHLFSIPSGGIFGAVSRQWIAQ